METVADINAETIARWIEEGWEWGKAIDHETFLQAGAHSPLVCRATHSVSDCAQMMYL